MPVPGSPLGILVTQPGTGMIADEVAQDSIYEPPYLPRYPDFGAPWSSYRNYIDVTPGTSSDNASGSPVLPSPGDSLSSEAPSSDAPSSSDDSDPWSEWRNDFQSWFEGLFASTGENILQSMNFNSAEAQKNRDWQERMANTAYQRAVADLKAAGLNPLLALGSAQQASTPSSTSASVNTVTGESLGSLLQVLAALASSIADFLPSKTISTLLKGVAK